MTITVLLVDDEPASLEIVKSFLEAEGDLVITAVESAQKAFDLVHANRFEMIVSDYAMPDNDGIELLKAIRREGNKTPFILFTGKGDEEVAIEALNSGADFYLRKGGNPESECNALANTIRNLHRQRKAEEQLVTVQRQIKTFLDNLPGYAFVKDAQGKYVLANKKFCDLIGTTPEDVVGKTAHDFYPKDLADQYFRDDMMVISSGEAIYAEEETGISEERIPIAIRKVPLKDEKGNVLGLVGLSFELTEIRKAEKALRESEKAYKAIFETTGASTAIIEEDTTILMVNSQFEKESGYSKEELEGKKRWTELVSSDDMEKMIEYNRRRKTDPDSVPSRYEIKLKDKWGRLRDVLLNVSIIPSTARTVVSLIDISEMKRTEEALFRANSKLTLLGSITRHDVLNQLSALFGRLDLARGMTKDKGLLNQLDKIEETAIMLKRQMEFTADYQKLGFIAPKWTDLEEAFVKGISGLDIGNLKVVTSLSGVEIFADPMIEKGFHNLVENTIRHGVKTTEIHVSFELSENSLKIIFSDDGGGVPKEEKNLIFKRGHGRHTGFGLYMTREILSITGINIFENGEPGKGVRFEIIVPEGMFRLSDEDISSKP